MKKTTTGYKLKKKKTTKNIPKHWQENATKITDQSYAENTAPSTGHYRKNKEK